MCARESSIMEYLQRTLADLQAGRYERSNPPEKTNQIRQLSSRPTTFVRIRSPGFCGHPAAFTAESGSAPEWG